MIYLDQAATSFLKPPEVAQAVYASFGKLGNAGRGAHAPTLNASRLLYDTREKLAKLLGISDPSRIAFTCNATEALNTAVTGVFKPGDHVITTVCEHNSVLRPLYRMEKQGLELTIINADKSGRLCYEQLDKSLRSNTKGVVVTHASNLTGNVTDLEKVGEFCRRNGMLFLVDASQTAGAMPLDVEKTGIDILCFTGHKGLLGPQGTGGIYVRNGLEVCPLKTGGSGIRSFEREHPSAMPEALEAGTLNGHGIAGLNAALDFLLKTGTAKIAQREQTLARQFADAAGQIEAVKLYGDFEAQERAAIVSLNIGDMDSALVSDILWEDYGICVRAGAHCAPLMHKVLGTEQQGAVRFSFSYFNTEREVEEAVRAVLEIAEGESCVRRRDTGF